MTLTAEEIDRQMQSATVPYVLNEVADQAKRVPELEAERDRYRKVVEAAQEHLRFCTSASRDRRALREILAAVGMKVEE